MDDTEILFHTPGPAEVAFPYHVVAAGRTRTLPATAAVRRRYNQHVLILTDAGSGRVTMQGRQGRARPGTLVWLDTGQDYAHGCAPGAAEWRYRWLGVQGVGLDALYTQWRAALAPVQPLADPAAASAAIDAILAAMRGHAADLSLRSLAGVAQLVAAFLIARGTTAAGTAAPAHPGLADTLLPRLRQQLARPWTVASLAAEAGLSASQLTRRFHAGPGLTPMAWLRRERINAAKALLLDPALSVQELAAAVGYGDPFHFSRDFRALTGRSPRAFRQSGGT